MLTDFSPRALSLEFQRQLSEACPGVKVLVTRSAGGEPVVTIPPKHPDVGGVTVWFDGQEITVGIGELWHSHFDCMKNEIGEERGNEPDGVAHAVEWVRLFLNDAIVLEVWEADGRCAGASTCPREHFNRADAHSNAKLFTWSGPWLG